MKHKLILGLALVAFNLSAHARVVQPLSDVELLVASDLVVIGQPVETKDLNETNALGFSSAQLFKSRFRGVETTFKVASVLKGTPTSNQIALHHYRFEIKWGSPPNGPTLVKFSDGDTNEYLLYLKNDGTNRFAPASGQIDPYMSFKSVVKGVNHDVTSEQNITNALFTLHVGMTMGETDQDLGRYSFVRVFTVSSAIRHSYNYFGISDMNDIRLQFDEHDKLLSWEVTKKVQK